jgi:hypothetical protein
MKKTILATLGVCSMLSSVVSFQYAIWTEWVGYKPLKWAFDAIFFGIIALGIGMAIE